MGAVRYNNKRLIPAPFVGISKQYQKSGQQKIGSLFTFNIQGKLLAALALQLLAAHFLMTAFIIQTALIRRVQQNILQAKTRAVRLRTILYRHS